MLGRFWGLHLPHLPARCTPMPQPQHLSGHRPEAPARPPPPRPAAGPRGWRPCAGCCWGACWRRWRGRACRTRRPGRGCWRQRPSAVRCGGRWGRGGTGLTRNKAAGETGLLGQVCGQADWVTANRPLPYARTDHLHVGYSQLRRGDPIAGGGALGRGRSRARGRGRRRRSGSRRRAGPGGGGSNP